MRPTSLAVVLTLVACTARPPPSPRAPRIYVQPAPPETSTAPIASMPAVAPPIAPEPIRTLTDHKVGDFILGVSDTRPVLFSFQQTGTKPDTTIVTTDLETGATVDSWTSPVLGDLAMSAWTPGHATKSKRSELVFDLGGRLDEVRAELTRFRDRLLEAGSYRLVGTIPKLSVSRDGKQLVFNGGDLLFYLGAGAPVLLENGASYDPVISPDGTRVAYHACPSPCSGRYTLHIATLSDQPAPRNVDSVVVSEPFAFWSEDGKYLYAITEHHCVVRVDERSLAVTKLVCDVEAMGHGRRADALVALVYANGKRELRTLALPDGKTTYRAVLDSKLSSEKFHLALVAPIAVSSGGQLLTALTGGGRQLAEIHVVDPRTGRQRMVAGPELDCTDLAWKDANTVVGLCRDVVKLFDFAALLAGP